MQKKAKTGESNENSIWTLSKSSTSDSYEDDEEDNDDIASGYH